MNMKMNLRTYFDESIFCKTEFELASHLQVERGPSDNPLQLTLLLCYPLSSSAAAVGCKAPTFLLVHFAAKPQMPEPSKYHFPLHM